MTSSVSKKFDGAATVRTFRGESLELQLGGGGPHAITNVQ
jgi:hypothetical protein